MMAGDVQPHPGTPPPQTPPSFALSAEDATKEADDIIAQRRALIDSIVGNVTAETATFSNVLLPLAHFFNDTSCRTAIISLLASTSADAKLRDACYKAEQLLEKSSIDATMREDIFTLVKAVYEKQKDDPSLPTESRRLLQWEFRDYIRMGMDLPPGPEKDRFKQVQATLSELVNQCMKNINEDDGGIWFTLQELQGVPNDVLDTLSKGEPGTANEGKLKLTFQYPDIMPTLKHCAIAETRKAMFLGDENRCNQNIPLFKQIVGLRDEAARLLGFPDNATFVLQDRMFATPQKVNTFLERLQKGLTPGGQREIECLKELKRSHGVDSDLQHYYHWDHQYYANLMVSQHYDLDQERVTEYFPLDACIENMLTTFQVLFGLQFNEVKPGKDRDLLSSTGNGNHLVWHPDVKLLSVWDADASFVGYLYFDLYPRTSKYGHAAMHSIQPGYVERAGRRQCPAAAVLCSFTKPTATKPSLLKHHEMVVLFHELGHAIHELVSRTTFARFHGVRGRVDFIEAPSQMLENWCWTPSTLKALSKHWSHVSSEYAKTYLKSSSSDKLPEEKMPDALIDSIIRTRHVNSALANLRQLHFAMFDQKVYSPCSHDEIVNLDASRLYNTLRREIYPLDDLGDVDDYHWGHGQTTFEHILGGMDAGYYGYLASLVYSSDMFDTAFSKNPMDREAGRRYRRLVLEPGGSKEEMEFLQEFLGREPSDKAFCKQLGIAP